MNRQINFVNLFLHNILNQQKKKKNGAIFEVLPKYNIFNKLLSDRILTPKYILEYLKNEYNYALKIVSESKKHTPTKTTYINKKRQSNKTSNKKRQSNKKSNITKRKIKTI